MNKDQIVFILNAIVRQLTCMNQGEFDKHLSNSSFEIQFDQFSFKDNAKIHTEIKMNKVEGKI